MEVENHHFIMAEVRNFETVVQNEGFDPLGEIQTGIYIYICIFTSYVIIYMLVFSTLYIYTGNYVCVCDIF